MTVYLLTDNEKGPGTIIAEDGNRVIVFWLWARKQEAHTKDELSIIAD